jgi:hypothetical protein
MWVATANCGTGTAQLSERPAPRAEAGTPAPIRREPPAGYDSPASPAVFFTDVEAGPVTGGPGSLGAPISIFGKGFGAARGDSRVTIGGVEVGSYLVWGAGNAHNKTLDLIVVQPGPKVSGGAIVVTVRGRASNTDHSFRVNSGKVYYTALNGNDSASCSATSPCGSILHVASNVMKAGDILLVHGGDYGEGEIWIRDGAAGTAGNPKVIKNYPGEEVYLSNAARGMLVDAGYITVSGLNFRNGKALSAVGWASPDQRGDRFINNTFVGNIAWSAIDTHGHDHLVAGNVCEISGSSVGTLGHCYYIANGTNLRILYNVGAGAPGYGLHIFDQRRATPDIRRVISNVVVEGNVLRHSTQRSAMIVSMADEGNNGNYIDNVIIRNNVFTGNNQLGLLIAGIVRNVKIYNNTFYENGRQSIQIDGSPAIDGIDIRNNLFFQSANAVCKTGCSWFPVAHVQVGPGARGVTINSNSYHPGQRAIVGGTDAAGVTGSVQFVDAAALDFHTLAGSAVIDRGVALPAVATDYDGRTRPAGGSYDIGAYELGSRDASPAGLSGETDTRGQSAAAQYRTTDRNRN